MFPFDMDPECWGVSLARQLEGRSVLDSGMAAEPTELRGLLLVPPC